MRIHFFTAPSCSWSRNPRSLFMLHDILFQIRMEDLLITLHPWLVIGIDARKRPLVGNAIKLRKSLAT